MSREREEQYDSDALDRHEDHDEFDEDCDLCVSARADEEAA